MPGGLDLLLLHAVLDGLRVDQLLQLLLLGDQKVVLVGGGLGGHLTRGVEHTIPYSVHNGVVLVAGVL